MTKKKRKPTKRVAIPVTEIPALPSVSLGSLHEAALQYLEAEQWDELSQFTSLELDSFIPEERADAENFQLRMRILELAKGEWELYLLPQEARDTVTACLQRLADSDSHLHKNSYFLDLYLQAARYTIQDLTKSLSLVLKAHAAAPSLWWAQQLRGVSFQLLWKKQGDLSELDASEQAILNGLPDLYSTLQEAYARLDDVDLNEYDRLFLRALKLDLESRMAEPWDYDRVAEVAKAISGLPAHLSEEANTGLTPQEWAFMLELQVARQETFSDLLSRYPMEFRHEATQGLRLLVQTLVAPSSDIDDLMVEAASKLANYANNPNERYSSILNVLTAEGAKTLRPYFGGWNIPDIGDLLLRLLESAPDGFFRQRELEALYRICGAAIHYEYLDDEGGADEHMPGLEWLCENCLAFQFTAAGVIEGTAGQLELLLTAIARAAEANLDAPYDFFSREITGEGLDINKVPKVLAALWRLVGSRAAMSPKTEAFWMSIVSGIFSALTFFKDKAILQEALALANEVQDDLLDKNEYFRLGYLEQMVGEPDKALRYYLQELETHDSPSQSVRTNVEILLGAIADADRLEDLVGTLREYSAGHRHSSEITRFINLVTSRITALRDKDQFERTAVNRWPKLTAQARQLLGVLENIKSYSNLRQLGEYAGMDEKWVGNHLRKLQESGMLFDTEGGYRINPHILPLLKQESQHAVVGKIIRANGTTAVKQVFNSGREFNIYQILVQLCPNHLVFPNCSLQSVMSYERMKELVDDDVFGYYLRASVDIVVVSSTTYLPMLAIEVDSVWHDTERQQKNDIKKDLLFATAGIPFLRLRPVGSPSEAVIRGQVAEHLDELVRTLRPDMPGYDQARLLVEGLSATMESNRPGSG